MSARTISIFVPPVSGGPIAIPMKRTALRRYWTRRPDGAFVAEAEGLLREAEVFG
jgi:hypothetical protein